MTELSISEDLLRGGERRAKTALDDDYAASARGSPPRASTSTRSHDEVGRSASRCRPGASAPAAPASHASPAPASRATSFDKLDDCAVIQRTRATPTVSLHIPWDKADDHAPCGKTRAARTRLRRHELQHLLRTSRTSSSRTSSARSATPTPPSRAQAVEHNLECIEIGRQLGSKALTVWIGDGSNFPGQSNFAARSSAISTRCARSTRRCPTDWRMFLEHKMYEPAFYSTVIADWGTSYLRRRRSSDRRRSAWSISATMRRTSTSR